MCASAAARGRVGLLLAAVGRGWAVGLSSGRRWDCFTLVQGLGQWDFFQLGGGTALHWCRGGAVGLLQRVGRWRGSRATLHWCRGRAVVLLLAAEWGTFRVQRVSVCNGGRGSS